MQSYCHLSANVVFIGAFLVLFFGVMIAIGNQPWMRWLDARSSANALYAKLIIGIGVVVFWAALPSERRVWFGVVSA